MWVQEKATLSLTPWGVQACEQDHHCPSWGRGRAFMSLTSQ